MTTIMHQSVKHIHRSRFAQASQETPAHRRLGYAQGTSTPHPEDMSIPTTNASHPSHLPAGGTTATTVHMDDTEKTSLSLLTKM
jgi:hypothetical protein